MRVLLALLLLLAVPARAQEAPEPPVALVADRVVYDSAAGTLTAEGNVEVYYGDRTLTATRIVYVQADDRVTAEGPLVLRGPEGAVIAADMAELDARLRDGLIRGARAALPGEVRMAAAEARRIDDRYNVLSRAVFSPCAVCPESPTPLWRIRAERIVHDQAERQITYENATFDVFGQPVAWTPWFRHPDPTLERASGLLPPEYLQSGVFGHAVKLPWHIVIDDQSDATITPFLTTGDGLLLEGEYRRRFERGALWLSGAITHQGYDGDDRLRGFLFGQGLWEVTDGAQLGFQLEQASDDPFLRRYQFSNKDRLTTEAFARAADGRGWGEVSLVRFQSLRDGEPAGQIPMALPVFEGRRVWRDAGLGGTLGLDVAAYALTRNRGQDSARGTLGVDWERQWITDLGLSLTGFAQVRGDAWWLQDTAPGTENQRQRFAPLAGVEARFPLMRRDAEGDVLSPLLGDGGATHMIEPIVQAILAPDFDGAPFPDEDSILTEFDETNLFGWRRHTGWDGFEEGPRLNLGLRYARIGDSGSRFSVSAGRVLRPEAIDSFAVGSGLNSAGSDYVGAWTLELPGTLAVSNRIRLDDDFEMRRNEIYAAGDWERGEFAASYAYLAADSVTPEDRHEIAGSARFRLTGNWFVGADLRRDLEAQRWVRTAGEIGYVNECVDITLTAGRDFTRTVDAPPTTFYGVRVRLWALGGDDRVRRVDGACAPRLR